MTEARLYTVKLDDTRDPALLAAYRELLSPEERARGDRYLVAHKRHEHLVTQALKRLVLGRLLGVAPGSLTFDIGEHGKPSLPSGRVRFNLTNTDGLVAMVVTEDAEVGVDAENIERRTDTVGIADRFFAEPEVKMLHATPAERQVGLFFEIWTLKEAYLKACGSGLHLPLGSFWFSFAPIGVTFAPPIVDDPARWRFFQSWVEPRWRLAAAVETVAGEPRLVVAGTDPPEP